MDNSKTNIEKIINSLSDRQVRWLSFYLLNISKEQGKARKSLVHYCCKGSLINFFSNGSAKNFSFYLNKMDSHLILDKCFAWLKNNVEAQYFVLSKLPCRQANGVYSDVSDPVFKANNALEEIFNVFDLDYYDDDLPTENYQDKVDKLRYYEKCYNESEWRLKLKKWIDKEKHNKEFERWLYEKVQKQIRISSKVNKFYQAKHTFEFCIALLCSYKLPQYGLRNYYRKEKHNVVEREVVIKKIKGNWNSKKHRMKNGKKVPHHMPLTKDTIKKLETLAVIQNLKREAIVTSLINAAYEKHCLDENGKEKY